MEQQPDQGGEHPHVYDHATARVIASQLHGGQTSPLYALVSSGALVDGLRTELHTWRRGDTPVVVEPWLDALDEYLDSRADEAGPIDGWSRLWPTSPGHDGEDDEPDTGEEERPPYGGSPACAIGRTAITATVPAEQTEDDGAAARQALFERISAAGVTTVSHVDGAAQVPHLQATGLDVARRSVDVRDHLRDRSGGDLGQPRVIGVGDRPVVGQPVQDRKPHTVLVALPGQVGGTLADDPAKALHVVVRRRHLIRFAHTAG
jgi:hypothetical protein